MVIRNHVIDPESSPSKAPYGKPSQLSTNNMNNGYNSPGFGGDDMWYNGKESPSAGSAPQMPNTYMQQPMGGYQQPMYGGGMNMGGMNMGGMNMGGGDDENFENEPPLLEELDINFDHIWNKTQAVMYVNKKINENILDDADLAGPLFYCLLLGACLLLSGKVHFGYIYGFSVFSCLGMNTLLNLLHSTGLDFWKTCSVLGYSLIPVIGLAAINIFISMRGVIGTILAAVAIVWATYSASRIFDAKLNLADQYWLVAYPVVLIYSCFVLITVF